MPGIRRFIKIKHECRGRQRGKRRLRLAGEQRQALDGLVGAERGFGRHLLQAIQRGDLGINRNQPAIVAQLNKGVGTENRNGGLALAELYQPRAGQRLFFDLLQVEVGHQTRIFGGVHGDGPISSPLVIQVTRQPRPPQPLAVFQNGNAFNRAPGITEALAYGAFPLRGLEAAKIHDVLSVYTDSFELELRFPAEIREGDRHWPIEPEIHRALWAWLHFGGLGGRVRRGFGAIELEKATGWKLPSIQEGWPGGQQHPEATWATLGALQDCVVVAKRPYGNGREAQEALLGLMRRMRQGDLGRKPNQPKPGRSYWPEPDAIRKRRE